MRIDSKSGARGMLVDVDTGRPIRWAKWADLDTGEYEAYRQDPQDALAEGIPPSTLLYRGKARLRFVPTANLDVPRAWAVGSDPRDLAGSLEEARRRFAVPKMLVMGEECDEPGCHALSAWRVSWEQMIEPEVDADGKAHERAVTTRVVSWCDRHYRPPVATSVRGVQSEVEVGARPQW